MQHINKLAAVVEDDYSGGLDYSRLENLSTPQFAGRNLSAVVSAILPLLYFAAGGLVLYYFIMGGYTLMFSGGEPGKVAEGKQKLTYALIGFLIVFTSYWVVQIIGSILGLDNLTRIFS